SLLGFGTALLLWPRDRITVESSSLMNELIADSYCKTTLGDSVPLEKQQLAAAEIPLILDFVEKHKDYPSYHLLFALRRHQLEAYKKIPPEVRAAILCSMLKEMRFFNDWCDPSDRIVDPRDISEAEKALLEIGSPAIKYLLPLLSDQRFVDLNDEE